ncbi:MAG: polysulfide reductase NrfD, partial [Acidimicrobiia bacterium]|nr:polysulfide reductase NrfD [Acidimicrobiia bacterium]
MLITTMLAIIGVGIYAWTTQLSEGLIVTGMRDRIAWGLYISAFVFFIGISHAGTLISAILRVTNAGWRAPITRIAEFITVVALVCGASLIIVDMGRPDRLLNVLIHGRWQSPILWDVMAISTYLTASIVYLGIPMVPDVAMFRERMVERGRTWRARFYKFSAIGWNDLPEQRKPLLRSISVMMVIIIPIAVSVHTVVSWIFGMTLRVGWNSTIFGLLFVAGAIFSGIATLVLVMAVLRKVYHLEEYITEKHFVNLGYLIATFTLIMMYINASEYLTTGFKLEEGEEFLFRQLFLGQFAGLYWFYFIGGLAVPGLLILIKRTRTIAGVITAAVLVDLAMFAERYFIVVSGQRVPLMPYEPFNYIPSWVEWSIFAAGISLFVLLIAVFVKVFPIMAVWEIVEERERLGELEPELVGTGGDR